uniref:Uncharacterized protein n=1 Tax=Helianthus annuus TaxID=4232 RepID=A0A251U648_HELAN
MSLNISIVLVDYKNRGLLGCLCSLLLYPRFTLITTPTPPLHPTSTKTLIPSLPPLISVSKLTLGFSDRRWGTIVCSEIHRYARCRSLSRNKKHLVRRLDEIEGERKIWRETKGGRRRKGQGG